jgi:hypothetical protein
LRAARGGIQLKIAPPRCLVSYDAASFFSRHGQKNESATNAKL